MAETFPQLFSIGLWLFMVGLVLYIAIRSVFNNISKFFKSNTENSSTSLNLPIEDNSYTFEKKSSVMTETEKKYFKQLITQYGKEYYVFPQINIDKLIEPVGNNAYWGRNKINRKSVDYVIADKQTLETLMVIELDDYTHRWKSRQKRDEFVNDLLEKCDVRLERV